MRDKRILLLFFIFILLNGLDVVTTVIGLMIGAAEANPVSQRAMSSVGFAVAVMLKFLLLLLLGVLTFAACWYATRKDPKHVRHTRAVLSVMFAAGIGWFIYALVNNLIVIWLQLNFYT